MVRQLALNALNRIFSHKEYSNLVINDILEQSDLNLKDRALFTQIVLGVIKNKLYLDDQLRPYLAGKNVKDWMRHLLILSLYQKIFLDKIPGYAIQNEAVEVAKRVDYSASKLINAVLRSFEQQPEPTDEWILYSIDEWLYKQIKGQYPDCYLDILKSYQLPPKISARVNPLKAKRELLVNDKFKASDFVNTGILMDEGNWAHTRLYKEGKVTIQDEASQLVARQLNPKRTDTVLDACAAPGGKTTHIAEIMKNSGRIIANDVHEHKLRLIEQNAKRLELTNIETTNYDATKLRKVFMREEFDKVLVDAPCTGWGVIGRKPEIKFFASNEKTQELMKIQEAILEETAPLVKVDGVLVYSTCTINRGENDVQIKQFLKRNPNFTLEKEIMVLPHEHHTDGFYIAKMKKVAR